MQLVKPESASHWYSLENGVWSPCYQLPKKNGDGMKAVTLREARELNLYPSVTSILSVINKPGLESWKQEQAILSALTLPRLPDEKLDEFVKRVVKDMDDQSEKARGFGSQIHAAIEGYFQHEALTEEIAPYLKSFIEWSNDQVTKVIGSEVICGCKECGYAGRLDLVCVLKDSGFSVIDAKTQNVKRNKDGIKQPIFYPEWPRQLAAYAHTYGPDSTECGYVIPEMISVIIDSSEPGPVYVKKWDNYLHHMEMFRHCLELWCDDRGYKPGAKA